jgi:MinD-like ATPase involved in chromosome partitioning or flagellar assembly
MEMKMKTLALIYNKKGGVGKSTFAVQLVSYLRNSGIEVAAYDGDSGNGSFYRRIAEPGIKQTEQNPLTGCRAYNIRAEKSTDEMDGRNTFIDCLEKGHDIVVHDLAGGSEEALMSILDDGNSMELLLATINSQGYNVVIFHVIDTSIEGVISVRDGMETFGDTVKHVVVLNKKEADSVKDFVYWMGFTDNEGNEKGGRIRKIFLENGGIEIEFPRLHLVTRDKMNAESIPLYEAQTSTKLTLTERSLAKKYIDNFQKAFNESAIKQMFVKEK